MFRSDVVHDDDPALQTAGLSAYSVLHDVVADLATIEQLPIDVDETARLCWSAMQGLLVLHPTMVQLDEMTGREPASRDDLVVSFTEIILAGLRSTRVP